MGDMKVAIQLTMHFVRNYGAILQTYALQRVIDSMPKWKCMTLDMRPRWINGGWSYLGGEEVKRDVKHKRNFFKRLNNLPSSVINHIYMGIRKKYVVQRWNNIFERFLNSEIRLTRHYESPDDFKQNPSLADVYITGSDQTFNPRFTKGELTWFWDFLPAQIVSNARKITYASSVGHGAVTPEYCSVYAKWLPKYDSISLREKSGVDMAKFLGVDAKHCCDPTLLLTREQWSMFANKCNRRFRKSYILCYNLRYAVNPYPMAEQLEEKISKTLGMPVLHLQEAIDSFAHRIGSTIRYATPYEFVDLFFNASVIMTSSLHGTIFALFSGKPFLAYVNDSNLLDCRVMDLLKTVKAEKHALPISEIDKVIFDLDYFTPDEKTRDAVAAFRQSSLEWMEKEFSMV